VVIGGFVDEVNQTALEPHLLHRGLHSLLTIHGRPFEQLLHFAPEAVKGSACSKLSDVHLFGFPASMLSLSR
jgi:hypothetical protein